MHKVVLITNAPTPYRIPFLNTLSHMLRTNNIHLKVFFCTQGYARRKWLDPMREATFEHDYLTSLQIKLAEEWYLFVPVNLLLALYRERPDIIVSGGFSLSTIGVFIFNTITRIPYMIWSGEIKGDVPATSPARLFVRRVLAHYAYGFVAYGTKAGEYCKSLDNTKPVFYGWNTVDTRFFMEKVANVKKSENEFAAEFDSSKTNIVAIGYLVKRKGFSELVRAINILRHERENFVLHIVGDGPERKKLEEMITSLDLDTYVRFWGYRQKQDLPTIFALSDIFVFPSLFDVWGLVLLEAMSAGLPVISSKYAGATHDLIHDGVNGYVIDPYNAEEMARTIRLLLDEPEVRRRIGGNAQKTIQENFTLEKSAHGFVEAVRHSLKL